MDEVIDLTTMKVVVDKKSVLYLYGTQLEYSDGLNGKGFHWVNPNASRTCGCGESFSL
jgi:iron-sulfur cluster assembly protein